MKRVVNRKSIEFKGFIARNNTTSAERCVLYRGRTTTDYCYSQQTLLRMASTINGMGYVI